MRTAFPFRSAFTQACVFALCLLPVVAQAQAPAPATRRPLTIDDLTAIKEVRDPQRSPDGKWVAYTVSTTDAEKDKRNTDVWMTSWDGAQHIRLTSSPDSESTPRWSPDGKYLAFLASRGDEDEKKKGAQVWLLNRAGGEAEKLTDMPGGVSGYEWSPDSTRLVLVSSDPDPADEPEKMEGWKRKTAPPIVITRYHFKEDRQGYLKSIYSQLHVFTLQTRKAEAVTSGPYDAEQPVWSPDGTRIAFVSKRSAGDPDRENNSDIFVVDAKAGAPVQKLTTFAGPDGGEPKWSPDGRWIAYLQGDEPRYYAYDQNKLAIVPAAGGASRVLTGAIDRAVAAPQWNPDSKSLVFLVEDDRAANVGKVNIDGGSVQPLSSGRQVFYDLSGGPDDWAVVVGTPTTPNEVYALSGGQLRRLTHHNDAWLATIQLSTTEPVTFTAKDGTVVNGLLVKPAGFKPGDKYPGLLNIHGGPNGQDDYSFDFEREFLAANGYLVLQVNYRGSSGRGTQFQKAIFGDWGHLEVVDLLAGADFLVTQGADPDRLGLGGWSYGGILTNYTIATDQRFRAAVSGASSSLQTSMYGVDQYIFQYETELGPPWKNPEAWQKVSYPFYRADRIKTPTLFLCGEKDFNVPVVGVEQMYQALRSLGVPTELVIYPGQFHGLTVPSYQRDRLTRYVAWYDKYLKVVASSQ